MHIEAIQKLTLLDFPGRTAATLFTHGCNFRCPFCHNAGLVVRASELTVSDEELFSFLNKRRGLLDGVCITGGEPMLQPDILEFMRKVRDMGYQIKLDTNGSFPDLLETAVDEGLCDYVAMDIKNCPEKYMLTAGMDEKFLPRVSKSVEFLLGGKVDYEFRTTVTGSLHTPDDIAKIGQWIKGAKRYYLQPFKNSGDIVAAADGGSAENFALPKGYAEALLNSVLPFVPSAEIRG